MISSMQLKTQIFDNILPNCKFIKAIGEGAFAQVFLIFDEKQKVYLAVKKISCFGLNQYEKKLVVNEAKILSSMQHPNIIQFHSCLYDSNEDDVYIFMQYAQKGDLMNLIYKSKLEGQPIKEKIIWQVLTDISQALKYLHKNKIIHRDVKPANILMQGNVFKLADMNVSKIKQQGIMTKTNIGTPLYTSPEVAKSLLYNQKCDIWSLGVVIFQLCCLKNPFNMTSLANLKGGPKSGISQKVPLRYSHALSDIISRMLKKNPDKRIQIDQILELCQIQGMKIQLPLNLMSQAQFKTIVFPQTSERFLNLVKNNKPKQNLDLTIDEILRQSQINDENKENSHNDIDQYGLSQILSKKQILKQQPMKKVNNLFVPQQDAFSYYGKGNQILKQNKRQSQKRKSSVSNDSKCRKFNRSYSRHKNLQFHSKQKPDNPYCLKFIKLSKNIENKNKNRNS